MSTTSQHNIEGQIRQYFGYLKKSSPNYWTERKRRENEFYEGLDLFAWAENLFGAKRVEKDGPTGFIYEVPKLGKKRIGRDKKGKQSYCALGEKSGGGPVQLWAEYHGIPTEKAYAEVRNYCRENLTVSYLTLVDPVELAIRQGKITVRQLETIVKNGRDVNTTIAGARETVALRDQQPLQRQSAQPVVERPRTEVTEFAFEPAEFSQYLLHRGITEETQRDPKFRGTFGTSKEEFLADNKDYPRDKFSFGEHVVFPFRDPTSTFADVQKVIAIEQRNEYTPEQYERKLKAKPLEASRSESLFKAKSARGQGVWISNYDENNSDLILAIFEQAIDAMSYFQLMKLREPVKDLSKYIFVATGGRPATDHFTIINTLIEQKKIQQVIIGADNDLPGLVFALNYLQHLPFRADKAKSNLHFTTKEANLEKRIRNYNTLKFSIARKNLYSSPEDAVLAVQDFRAAQTYLRNMGGRDWQMRPSYSLTSPLLMDVYIDGSIENFRILESVVRRSYKVSDQVKIDVPLGFKDFNDEVRNIPIKDPQVYRPLIPEEDVIDKVHIDKEGRIVVTREYYHIERQTTEVIGRIQPFRADAVNVTMMLPFPQISEQLDSIKTLYEQKLPIISTEYFNNIFLAGLKVDPKSLAIKRNDKLVAQLNATGAYELQDVVTSDEQRAIRYSQLLAKNPDQALKFVPTSNGLSAQLIYKDVTLLTVDNRFRVTEMKVKGLDVPTEILDLMEVFEDSVSMLRRQYVEVLEKFPEPIQIMTASNLQFKLDQETVVAYNPMKNTFEWSLDFELSERRLHPYNMRALSLFLQNKGEIYNYSRALCACDATQTIHYGGSKSELGKFTTAPDGSTVFILYNKTPKSIADELVQLAGWKKVDVNSALELGMIQSVEQLDNKFKGKQVNFIPYEIQNYFDEYGRLKKIPDGLIKQMKPYEREAYEDAIRYNKLTTSRNEETMTEEVRGAVRLEGNSLWYKSIEVGSYDPINDRLILIGEPGPAFAKEVAVLEMSLVKKAENRQYSEYLGSDAGKTTVSETPIGQQHRDVLERIKYNTKDKTFKIHISGGKFDSVGLIENSRLSFSASVVEFSPIVGDVIRSFAKSQDLTVDFDFVTPSRQKSEEFEQSVVVVSDRQKQSYDIALQTFGDVMADIYRHPEFNKTMSYNNGVEFIFTASGGRQVVFKLGEQLPANEGAIWTTKMTPATQHLVLVENPETAIEFFQYRYPESILGREQYVCILGKSQNFICDYLNELTADSKGSINSIYVAGSKNYRDALMPTLRDNVKIPLAEYLTVGLSNSLKRAQQFLSKIEPSPALAKIEDKLSTMRHYQPAPGILAFPVKSATAQGVLMVGNQVHQSKLADALYFSAETLHPSVRSAVVLPNIREAIHYGALNNEFLANTALVVFNASPTAESVKYLNKQLAHTKFEGKVKVANTLGLMEQIKSVDRKFEAKIILPEGEATFEREFTAHQKEVSAGHELVTELGSRLQLKREVDQFKARIGERTRPTEQ